MRSHKRMQVQKRLLNLQKTALSTFQNLEKRGVSMTCFDGGHRNPLDAGGFSKAAATDHGVRRALGGGGPSCLTMRDTSMRCACTLAAMIWISGGVAAYAQTGSTTGMGATSPLGTQPSESSSSASSSSALGGIPLGATELTQSGISPLTMPCPNTGSNASFDGGGTSSASGCGSAGTNSSSGTAS